MSIPEKYQTASTSPSSMVVDDRVLSETGSTRKVLRATIVKNENNPEAIFKITLIHQRKKKADGWEDTGSIPLTSLKSGEGVKFDLDSETTLKLYRELQNLQGVAEKMGVQYGRHIVELTEVTPEKAPAIQKLISNGYPEQMLELLGEDHPELVAKLGAIKLQEDRKAVLDEFRQSLEEKKDEDYWKSFFEKYSWIFGYGLRYHVLKPVQDQPFYGGKDVQNQGGQKGDHLHSTQASVKFTVLIEIKKPETKLLKEEYRNGCWSVSDELAGGVAQLQGNCLTWETRGSTEPVNQEFLAKQDTLTVMPKGILVIGSSDQLSSRQERVSFELFRRNLANPEVLTFDELYERAKFIVESGSPKVEDAVNT